MAYCFSLKKIKPCIPLFIFALKCRVIVEVGGIGLGGGSRSF